MKRLVHACLLLCIGIGVLAFVGGCESVFQNTATPNRSPEVWLSSGPVEGDTVSYRVHFYWGGWDPDGEVKAYEYVVVDGGVMGIGFNPEDTTGVDKWSRTFLHDSTFTVRASMQPRKVTINNVAYTRYDMTHTFFVRAVDLEGRRSEPAYRSFTAWTLAPYCRIDKPTLPTGGTVSVLGRTIKFEWVGQDPVDSPNNLQDPDSVRYMCSLSVDSTGKYTDNSLVIIADLNKNPWRYEGKWSPWISYSAPGDSGKTTVLGDDEVLELSKSHVFAIQAKDDAGAVTALFDPKSNVRRFVVSKNAVPVLKLTEPFLGAFVFRGTNMRVEKRDVPPGVTFNFRWRASAQEYGGEISTYRYGWDVLDVNNPSDWDVLPGPTNLTCTKTLYAGVHFFYVETVDKSGGTTLGVIELDIVPFWMERNLLWVDDYYSTDFTQEDWAQPTETQHNTFWLRYCNNAIGFDPLRDVYDVYNDNAKKPPEIALIGQYKNIIWTSSGSPDDCAWDDIVYFTNEDAVNAGSRLTVNYLAIFLAKGGHLLTEGRADRTGGLAAVLSTSSQVWPLYIKCELATGPTEGCEGDTSGVNSFAYKDYCVSVLDKIVGTIRTTTGMPTRKVRRYDVMRLGLKARDAVTDTVVGLPDSLLLNPEIVKTGRFFDPNGTGEKPGGFTYIEIYNPDYWMTYNGLRDQPCFHPMFNMRTVSLASVLNDQAFAIWVTKYEDVVPQPRSGLAVAAPSVHFGTELWFHRQKDVDKIMNVVFRKWQIRKTAL